jgi:hypothetical protein
MSEGALDQLAALAHVERASDRRRVGETAEL